MGAVEQTGRVLQGAQTELVDTDGRVTDSVNVVSVLPDVTGLDRVFDYVVPDDFGDVLNVGDLVRVPLHGRNVRGWIVATAPNPSVDVERLKPVTARLGCGPEPAVVDLARWVAQRWCGRWRSTLTAGTPSTLVRKLPAPRRTSKNMRQDSALSVFDDPRAIVVRRGPRWDLSRFLQRIQSRGPVLVVVPTLSRAGSLSADLRRLGLSVALYADDWSLAAGGVDVTVGARSAVFASVPDLASIVVVDEHDDALQETRNPTWHAREVAVERARVASIPCFLLSPIPSVAAVRAAENAIDTVENEKSQWPRIEIVDRTVNDEWSSSLVSSRLVEIIRAADARVVVVHNVKGGSRLLACNTCRSIATCEVCLASAKEENGRLVCGRCGADRPMLCQSCAGTVFKNLRPGVKRLGEDLLKASGRNADELCVVDAASEVVQRASLFVGTEAAIHRVRDPDVIVFADIDQELLAPRYRASEIVGGLSIAAARAVGDGLVVVQTHVPRHPLLVALAGGEIGTYLQAETETRRLLRLPPFSVLVSFAGAGGKSVAEHIAVDGGLDSWGDDHATVVRFPDRKAFLTSLSADESLERGSVRDVRIHVDPPRI